jgi:hypothetical protein
VRRSLGSGRLVGRLDSRSLCQHAVSPGGDGPTTRAVGLTKRWDGVKGGLQHERVVNVGLRGAYGKQDAAAVDDEVAFAPRLAAVGGGEPGPLAPLWPARSPSPTRPVTSQSSQRSPGAAAIRDVVVPTLQPVARHAGVASTSCHCHTPSRSATVPSRCHSSGQGWRRSRPCGRLGVGGRPWAWATQQEAAAQ